jgi:lysophospholipid acyltransferase (LPLAT)-like uncharacterized protein
MPWLASWPVILYRLYLLLAGTWRMRGLLPGGRLQSPSEYSFEPAIYAHSEQDDLVLAALLGRSRFVMMVTKGRDGDLAAQPLEAAGVTVIRGSSLHSGSEALMDMVVRLRNSAQPCVICVDGPIGPRGKAKPGVFVCAQHSGRPIIPVAAAARHAWVFRKSWAQMYLPFPLSLVAVALGEPIRVGPETTRAEIEYRAAELSESLASARQRATSFVNA